MILDKMAVHEMTVNSYHLYARNDCRFIMPVDRMTIDEMTYYYAVYNC